MKKMFLINLLALLILNFLIIFEVKDFFGDLEINVMTVFVLIFSFVFVMFIMIFVLNIIFSFVLNYFTSYDLDYEENRSKVLNTIILVNEILLLVLYLILLIDPNLIFTLQAYKLVTPIIFSVLFSILLSLKLKDFIFFNVSMIVVNILLVFFEKILNLYVHI
ncbi:hypothetical protein [Kurthia sibirica]|uniref:Uncharacterized protein n=1 Tax=Kurthia sibirica TaxID=202750 RepID=A0A2U3AG86_9BACL|nr:hypothetical protein [Kurthia sibirica]PWI23540.1 hypothetical protein DEX24_15995 [Kurthia sibirica]GEK35644.1 hypothetical protein KSI01_31770 [Kurthia sibirica]